MTSQDEENAINSNTSPKVALQVHAGSSMNDSGTGRRIGTPLTQRRSLSVRGFVYFIRVGEFIKIGFSTRPLDRLRALQTSHAEKLEIVGTRRASQDLEGELHTYFADYRVRGEWFHAMEPILTYIEENTPEGRAAAGLEEEEKESRPSRPPLPPEIKAMVAQLINFRSGGWCQHPGRPLLLKLGRTPPGASNICPAGMGNPPDADASMADRLPDETARCGTSSIVKT